MTVTKSMIAVFAVNQRFEKKALLRGLGVVAVGLAGCVNVAAPHKPIEINLNINIRQEVLVKLEKDVQDLINKNPGVF